MRLTFSERYVLQEVLPQQGSLAEQGWGMVRPFRLQRLILKLKGYETSKF